MPGKICFLLGKLEKKSHSALITDFKFRCFALYWLVGSVLLKFCFLSALDIQSVSLLRCLSYVKPNCAVVLPGICHVGVFSLVQIFDMNQVAADSLQEALQVIILCLSNITQA